MTRKGMLMIKGKYRYGKPSEKEVIKWDASGLRLSKMMNLAEISASTICRLSEGSGDVIYNSNISNYKSACRRMTDKHLELISRILFDALKEKGYEYNYDLFKLYLSGADPTCDTYEEFESMALDDPDLNYEKYRDLFKHAGFIIYPQNGFYSITDDQDNDIDHGYDDPEYSLYFSGVNKHLSPDQMETYYQKIIKYMQDSFSELKEGDVID